MRQDVLIVERRRSYIVCDALDANIDCERDAGVGGETLLLREEGNRRVPGEERKERGSGDIIDLCPVSTLCILAPLHTGVEWSDPSAVLTFDFRIFPYYLLTWTYNLPSFSANSRIEEGRRKKIAYTRDATFEFDLKYTMNEVIFLDEKNRRFLRDRTKA